MAIEVFPLPPSHLLILALDVRCRPLWFQAVQHLGKPALQAPSHQQLCWAVTYYACGVYESSDRKGSLLMQNNAVTYKNTSTFVSIFFDNYPEPVKGNVKVKDILF